MPAMAEAWKTFGHGWQKDLLSAQLAAGALPNAYLFLGPEGLGKRTLAFEFAARALGTTVDRLPQHPDFLLLEPEEDSISTEAVGEFLKRMAMRPFAAARKVAIVDRAETLNQFGENALLKTLEEPAQATHTVLVSSRPLLKTIRSRCQVLSFSRFTEAEMNAFAADGSLKAGADLVTLCSGAPGRLVRLSEDAGSRNDLAEQLKALLALRAKPVGERLAYLPKLAENEDAELAELLTTFSYQVRLGLARRPESHQLLARTLASMAALSGTNRNKKLVLQGLLLSM